MWHHFILLWFRSYTIIKDGFMHDCKWVQNYLHSYVVPRQLDISSGTIFPGKNFRQERNCDKKKTYIRLYIFQIMNKIKKKIRAKYYTRLNVWIPFPYKNHNCFRILFFFWIISMYMSKIINIYIYYCTQNHQWTAEEG